MKTQFKKYAAYLFLVSSLSVTCSKTAIRYGMYDENAVPNPSSASNLPDQEDNLDLCSICQQPVGLLNDGCYIRCHFRPSMTCTASTICRGKIHFHCLVERMHINFKLDEDVDSDIFSSVSDVLSRLSRLSTNYTHDVGASASNPFDQHSASTANQYVQHPSSDRHRVETQGASNSDWYMYQAPPFNTVDLNRAPISNRYGLNAFSAINSVDGLGNSFFPWRIEEPSSILNPPSAVSMVDTNRPSDANRAILQLPVALNIVGRRLANDNLDTPLHVESSRIAHRTYSANASSSSVSGAYTVNDSYSSSSDRVDSHSLPTYDQSYNPDTCAACRAENFLGQFYAVLQSIQSNDTQLFKDLVYSNPELALNIPKMVDCNGSTLLMLASKKGGLEIIHCLCNYGSNLYAVNKLGKTALDYAGNDQVRELLKSCCVNPIAKNFEAFFPPVTPQSDLIRCLSTRSIVLGNKSCYSTGTPRKISSNQIPTKFKRNKKLNPINFLSMHKKSGKFNGFFLLEKAIEANNLDVIIFLACHGVNLKEKSKDGYTLLHLAIIKKANMKIVQYLARKLDVNEKDAEGCTALHLAILENAKKEIVEFLVENGSNTNIRDNAGLNVLHLAILQHKQETMVAFLASRVDNINERDNEGWTALHLACMNQSKLEIIASLFRRGADPNARSNGGISVLDLANTERRADIITLLTEQSGSCGSS